MAMRDQPKKQDFIMTNIIIPPKWQLKEKAATPESIYFQRREILHSMGFVGAGALALLTGCD